MATTKSLLARESKLAKKAFQREILQNGIFQDGSLPTFAEKIKPLDHLPLRPRKMEILQINLGYMCNQVCAHCHVDAGPDRKEIMTRETMEHCLRTARQSQVKTVDLTGGAPEMNHDFRWLVEQLSEIGVEEIIVRSNLTIILANPKYHDLPQFFARHGVHVVSSLPFYRQEKTDKQRGSGVFHRSIEALQMLNAAGYGKEGSGLILDMVYNPSGAFLPGDQHGLENDFKAALKSDFDIDFNSLFTITNMPISRFLDYLLASENYEDYMYTLVDAFNPAAVDNVMCKNTLSVGWDGKLYDCDFNQMLEMEVDNSVRHIADYDEAILQNRAIAISQHCFVCTAGAGSSCQGTVA